MEILLDHSADVNVKDIYGTTPLHLSCRIGRCRQVRRLLEAGARVDDMNNDGWTGMHIAAEAGHEDIVKVKT